MNKDKIIKCKIVGIPPNEKMVDVCDIEGCWEVATQFHGTIVNPIRTCDEHAEQVMLEILSYIVDDKEPLA